MSEQHVRTIVVGYDGSPASRAALHLATERARGGRIFVVHAYDAPADFWGDEHYAAVLEHALARGTAILRQVEMEEADAETELIAGAPARVLATVAETRQADEIIVGTRGFGRLRAALGSVAHELLHLAPCPVTVIPARLVAGDAADAADAVPARG